MAGGRPKSAHDNVEMPLACETPGCFNAATGRRDGKLVCDACSKGIAEAEAAKNGMGC
jgi:hypothetical protein